MPAAAGVAVAGWLTTAGVTAATAAAVGAITTAAVTGVLVGGAIGAATSLATGGDILQGTLKGALIGGITMGAASYLSGAATAAGTAASAAEAEFIAQGAGTAAEAAEFGAAYGTQPLTTAGTEGLSVATAPGTRAPMAPAMPGAAGAPGVAGVTPQVESPASILAQSRADMAAINASSLKTQAGIGLLTGAANAYSTMKAADKAVEGRAEDIKNMAAAEEAKKAGNKAGTAATLQPWQAVWKKTWQGDYETAVNGPLAKYRQPDKNTGLLRSPA